MEAVTATYTRVQDIPSRVVEELVATGAEGELGLGLLNRLAVVPDMWGDRVLLLAVYDGYRPVAFIMQTGDNPTLIVGFGIADELDYQALTDAIADAGFHPTSINGARRFSDPLAAAWIGRTGELISKTLPMRAMELRAVLPQLARPSGALRLAREPDLEVVCNWTLEFSLEALNETEDRQTSRKRAQRFMDDDDLVLWEVDDEPVAMAAVSRRTDQSACISLVYTPPEHRGCGYARTLVADLSQRELDEGCEWTSLFTDATNPTSNWIYEQIGYCARAEFAHHTLVPRS